MYVVCMKVGISAGLCVIYYAASRVSYTMETNELVPEACIWRALLRLAFVGVLAGFLTGTPNESLDS